jgi:flagellin|nr:flagellin [Neorhizobium tomejilense]
MTSILTNIASMAALQTLRSLSDELGAIQGQVSSGYRIEQAKDNAAYWSIATTMRSDGKALAAVQDAIELGAAKVNTAYVSLEQTIGILDEVKRRIVAASEPGVDRMKIQEEIAQLQQQSLSAAESASFAGQNLVMTDFNPSSRSRITTVASSFSRNENGVSVGTTEIDLKRVSLYNSQAGGLLQASVSSPSAPVSHIGTLGGLAFFSGSDATGNLDGPTFDAPFQIEQGDEIQFHYTVGGTSHTLNIDRDMIDTALPGNNGIIYHPTDLSMVINHAVDVHKASPSDPITLMAWGDATQLHFIAFPIGSSLSVSPATATTSGLPPAAVLDFGLQDIDVSADDANLASYLSGTEIMLQRVTSAAAFLGAVQAGLAKQMDYMSVVSDSIDRGVGRLVDADMNAASARLRALQAQQRLGIQSLQIANSDSQNVVQLFR